MRGSDETRVSTARLADFTQDAANHNRGTARGGQMLRESVQECGAGRSLLCDADGNLIAGNKSVEAFAEVGLDDAIVVETDGTRPVVVKRTDLRLFSEGDDGRRARRLAYFDNLTQQASFSLDPVQVARDAAAGLDFAGLLTDEEQTQVFRAAEREARGTAAVPEDDGAEGQGSAPMRQAVYPLAIVLTEEQASRWDAWKLRCGKKLDTKALLALLDEVGV